MNRIVLAAALLAAPAAAVAPPAPEAATKLGPCVNLGNYLEADREGQWGPPLTDRDLKDIAAAGFRTVRLPVKFSAYAQEGAPYTIDPALFRRVDHILAVARGQGLRVILDLHNYDGLTSDPAANTARFAALWRQIAEHYRAADPDLWFELVNEPHDKLTNANLVATLAPALAEIRKVSATRRVVYGGQGWSGVPSLATLPVLDDPNTIVTFHYYEPFAFTHQGAKWVTPTPPVGRKYPAAGDAAALAKDVAAVRAFVARTGRPVFMGEFGAKEGISTPERLTYYRSVRSAFAAAGIEGCAWAYANTFPIREQGKWVPGMLSALGVPAPAPRR